MSEKAQSSSLVPHVLGGVCARVAAESFKSPFDLVKVRLQYDKSLKSRPLALAMFTVLREEGLSAWRGLPPRLIWSAPLAGATFTYYQLVKRETSGGGGGGAAPGELGGGGGGTLSFSSLSLKTLLGGPMVIALSVALRTPFDIIEQRLQLQAAEAQAAAAAAEQQAAASAAAPKPASAAAATSAAPSAAARSASAGAAGASAVPPPTQLEPTPRAILAKIQSTWRAEGVRGVWRGYTPSFFGISSCAACHRGVSSRLL